MKNKTIKYIALGIGAYAIFATSVLVYYKDNPGELPWDDREDNNRQYIASLSFTADINRDMIFTKLGAPDISEGKRSEDEVIQVLFYRTQHVKSDGITTKDECTALLFKNDKLIAWGEAAYQQYKEKNIDL